MPKVLFIDRDGTLIEEPEDEQVDRLDKLALVPEVIPALLRLSGAGYELVLVSNQDGLGTEAFPEADFQAPHDAMLNLFASQGIHFSRQYICPHLPADGCDCRKPATGLLKTYLDETDIDRENSFVIGDRDTDMAFAKNLGLQGLLLNGASAGRWSDIAETILRPLRTATVQRNTTETQIDVQLWLDDTSTNRIDTGIAFLDHMIEQLAVHAGFALKLSCRGDLQIDDHHSVEDVALAIGTALNQALGDRRGIGRYGFVLPMDESLAQIAIDLSGRPHCSFEGQFSRPMVGQLATEMVPHFFRSLAQTLGASIHVTVKGDNTHHMIEAVFKGVGRALRPALTISGTALPSSKGVL